MLQLNEAARTRLPLERANCMRPRCPSIYHQDLPQTVYQGYYPVSAVVYPYLCVSPLALEMSMEVMLPIDLEQALSVCPPGSCGLGR